MEKPGIRIHSIQENYIRCESEFMKQNLISFKKPPRNHSEEEDKVYQKITQNIWSNLCQCKKNTIYY